MKNLLLISFCFYSLNIIGQNSNDTLPAKKNQYFGVNAGFTTGLGFSYNFWPGKNGIQITFMPLFDKYKQLFSAGLTYLMTLKDYNAVKNFNDTKLFLFVGNHVYNLTNDEIIYNFGIGPGIEGGMGDIKIRFMVGYAVLNIPDNPMSRPTVEGGLFYHF